MIRSVIKYVAKPFETLIVYDLGLTSNTLHILQEKGIAVRSFPFSQHKAYFNIDVHAGQYAWKPVIIQSVANDFPEENILWMDAGNIVHQSLEALDAFITKNGIYTAVSSGTVKKWTHPDTLKYMHVPNKMLVFPCRNAACVGFNPRIPYAKQVLQEWSDLAQIEECIAPSGSSRSNHRQDQAVLTILFYKCIMTHSFAMFNAIQGFGYTIHNDID